MKSKQPRGTISASSPVPDILKSLPQGATVIAAAGSRTLTRTTYEVLYSHNGATVHISITQQKGGQS
jgi:hypothetical protein